MKIKITSNKAMLKLLKNKKILFLEDDFTLTSSVGFFYEWCRENKIETNVLFNIKDLPIVYIMQQIEWYDVITFQTTWAYRMLQSVFPLFIFGRSHKLYEKISKLKDKKIIIECYVGNPTWYCKPKKIIHDVYILNSFEEDMEEWKFKKLRINKMIWEK